MVLSTSWRKHIEKPISMTDSEWEVFEMAGGEVWLRQRLMKMHKTGVAKRNRNNRIRRDKAAGMTDIELAEKYNVARTTIWRIVS